MCFTPFTVTNKVTGMNVSVPCGKCPKCTARRTSAWSFRLMQEEKISESAHFITLTYDTDHVPITPSGFTSLRKKDCQDFFKRLRKNPLNIQNKIKYYLAAEYGSNTRRPHYHAIIFNVAIQTIQAAWQQGDIHYGTVSAASVGYCLKYINKGRTVPLHKNDDRAPEFSLMSKGLGENYLTPQMVKWHKNDKQARMYCNLKDGKKIAMPRYYKDKIYSDIDRKVIAAKAKIAMEQKHIKDYNKDPENFYLDQFEYAKQSFERAKLKSKSSDKI